MASEPDPPGDPYILVSAAWPRPGISAAAGRPVQPGVRDAEGNQMSRDRAEKAARRELLAGLARELRQAGGPGCRRGWTLRLVPYLSVRRPGRRRMRVYCAGASGAYGFLTGSGQLVSLAGGVAAAAREIAAACGRPAPGLPAQRAAAPPGP